MQLSLVSPLSALCDRYVAELFEFSPGEARTNGDHSYDGRLGPVGAVATARRVRQLDDLAGELDPVVTHGIEERVDAITLRHRLALERFHLVVLDASRHNPFAALLRGADPQPYCHEYAPVPIRAEGLARHLGQLPDWLDAALEELGDSLDEGPRMIAIDVARGLASFYSDDLDTEFPLGGHPQLRAQLRRCATVAAAACARFAAALEAREGHPTPPLGEHRFLAMLEAQEGVSETCASLRATADAELASLRAEFEDLAERIAPGEGAAGAIRRMEEDHPTRESLITEAASSLDRIRDFWIDRDVVTIPDATCRVLPSPAFLRFLSAGLLDAGTLAPDVAPSHYIVTPVDSSWSDQQADEWLRSLNRWLLENVGVHEVYPGHFVHLRHARDQRSLLRRLGYVNMGFIEGWAHYTEQLAIEQGLAENRPLLHLAQLQDALLRACRFRATVALHTEGATLEDVTALFVKETGTPEFPSRREAERGTYDPMYLSYTYGKLQILSWRAELARRPRFSLRDFHNVMLGSGFPPLAAVRELVMSPG